MHALIYALILFSYVNFLELVRLFFNYRLFVTYLRFPILRRNYQSFGKIGTFYEKFAIYLYINNNIKAKNHPSMFKIAPNTLKGIDMPLIQSHSGLEKTYIFLNPQIQKP